MGGGQVFEKTVANTIILEPIFTESNPFLIN